MANVLFKKGLLSALPSSYKEGTIYVTTDERAMYLDVSDSQRIRLGDFIEVQNIAALPASGASQSALYYATDENVLAKWNGTKWVQINPDNYTTVSSFAQTIAAITDGVSVSTALKQVNEDGTSAKDFTAAFQIVSGSENVKITNDGASKVKISATDSKVTSAANHYDPAADAAAAISITSKTVIDTIQRDAKGHVTGVTTRAENDINKTNVTTSLSGKTATVKTSVAMNSGAAKEGAFTLAVAGDATIARNSSGTLTITANDTKVTSVENHYEPQGPGTVVEATADTSTESNLFVTSISKDAAGHIVGVTTKEAVIAPVSKVDVGFKDDSNTTDNKVYLSTTVTHGSSTPTDAVAIHGADATTVSVNDSNELIITSTDTKVDSVENHYGYSSSNPSAYSAKNGEATVAKAITQVVTGVTVDKAGHVTGVTSAGVKDTHANVQTLTTAAASNNGNGWTINITDTDGIQAAGSFDPTIVYGKENGSTAHGVNNKFDLNVYTIPETDAKIVEAIQATGAMVLVGEISAKTDNLPTTKTVNGNTVNIAQGDVLIVTGKFSVAGKECEAGDTFVAKKDSPTSNDDWYYIPSGNDDIVFKRINDTTNGYVGVDLQDGNSTVNGPKFGGLYFMNNASTSKIVATGQTLSSPNGGEVVGITINMEWGSF